MGLTIFDHILAVILFIVMPVLSVTDFRRLKAGLNEGRPTARLSFYRGALAWEWVLTLAIIALWIIPERDFTQLGFGFDVGRGFWIGAAIVTLVGTLLIVQANVLMRDREKRLAASIQFESLQAMIPRTGREAQEFAALSITAGICEEILYRGYLMVYITSLIAIEGMLPALLLSSLAFGLTHAYQGPKGVLKTGMFGLGMASLYLLTGSLWLVILLHAVVDLINGNIGRQVMSECEKAPAVE